MFTYSKNVLILIYVLGLVVFIATSCGPQTEEQSFSELDSYPRLASAWNSSTINVCWESSADRYDLEKQWVQDKVESQYNERTNVRLTGWEDCPDGRFTGIRMGVFDGGPHTRGLGKALTGTRNGMMHNFEFDSWSTSCQRNRKRCIQGIAVHEFGHALGLAHEHNRPDTPETCTRSRQGTNGDREVGSWDLTSVMNYCNPVYNNNGNLSSGDIRGINILYPRSAR